jgi:Leucine Rich repeat
LSGERWQNLLLRLPEVADNGAMQSEPRNADQPKRKLRWLRLTLDRVLLSLLIVEVFILSCASFHWLGFHEDRISTAWWAFGSVAVAAVLFLIRPHLRGRRWYQFSLRSMLIFTFVCAVASAWVARRMEQKRKEQESVEAIVKNRGWVAYDYQIQEFSGFNAAAQPPGPEWLLRLLGKNFFADIEDVDFTVHWRPIVTDDDLVHLKELPNLKGLVLRNAKISDAGLANLEELTKLRALDLNRATVTDAGLVHLQGLTSLTWLDLRGTEVTDAGRAELQNALPRCLLQR